MKLQQRLFLLSILLLPSSFLCAAQESESVETTIKTLMLDPNSQTPIVILETVADKKLLPIWIDVPEARAIALEIEHVSVLRPLTHDLIRNILQALGASLRRVTITDLNNSTYFAVLSLQFKGQELSIDARPSDAIAIALRMKAPIYVSNQVLAKARSVPALRSETSATQKRLGIRAQDLTAEIAALLDVSAQSGVLITDVAEGGVAMASGIERGDVITKADDQPIRSTADLDAFVQSTRPGARIKLEVMKKDKPTIIEMDLPS